MSLKLYKKYTATSDKFRLNRLLIYSVAKSISSLLVNERIVASRNHHDGVIF